MKVEDIISVARNMPELVEYQHFEITETVSDFASELAGETSGDRFPISSNLPNKKMTVSFDEFCWLLSKEVGDDQREINGVRIVDRHGFVRDVGWWRPGTFEAAVADGVPFDMGAMTVELLAYVVALINEPRIVVRSSNGSRQQRRAVHRGMGFAVDAWTRVSWDLSKETVAKLSRDPGFHKMPLHWRRGHFRRAEEHFKGAMQRPDAIRAEDRGLWWQWIEGQWVGHPAFGVKKSVHAPRLSGSDIAHRRAA